MISVSELEREKNRKRREKEFLYTLAGKNVTVSVSWLLKSLELVTNIILLRAKNSQWQVIKVFRFCNFVVFKIVEQSLRDREQR